MCPVLQGWRGLGVAPAGARDPWCYKRHKYKELWESEDSVTRVALWGGGQRSPDRWLALHQAPRGAGSGTGGGSVPWTARRSNESILKEISPGIFLEGMMLQLKLQYFGHLMQRVDSLEKTLMLGGIGGRRRRGRQKMRWLDGITDSM